MKRRSRTIRNRPELYLLCLLFVTVFTVAAQAVCPILISDVYELQLMNNDLDGWYILTNDIDAVDTNSWNSGQGFLPIGDPCSPFIGIFDGQGHTIDRLYINRPITDCVGLFGYIANGAIVKNTGLQQAQVTAQKNSGSLVGYSTGATVENCWATGSVSGAYNDQMRLGGLVGASSGLNSFVSKCWANVTVTAIGGAHQVGGLAGYNGHGSVMSDCYALGNVTGTWKVGGLVGDNLEEPTPVGTLIERCYSAGLVTGTGGGLVGFNFNGGVTQDSYWDINTSGKATSNGGLPKTTAEMQQQATFVIWDFTTVWDINENSSYPWLRSDITPALVTYYVDDDALGDPGPGDPMVSDPLEDGSIDHPFDSIQEAIDTDFNNCPNDCYATVIVKPGVYYGQGNYNITTRGKDIAIISESDARHTIIACRYQGRGFIIADNATSCTVIDGFGIVNGYATNIKFGDLDSYFGGGIFISHSNPIIQNCVIFNCQANFSGGGIYLYYSDAQIIRCEILLNRCEVAGGAVYMWESEPLMENCVVAGNYGAWSGGISSNDYSSSTIVNCTIADNYAEHGPDGLECYNGGHADVKNCIFWTDTRWWLQAQDEEPNENSLYQRHIFVEEESSISISYCNIEGGYEGVYIEPNSTLEWGRGNLNVDPCFAELFALDYHLKSGEGRWTWLFESNGDYNDDWIINFKDYAILIWFWNHPNPPAYVDLDNDGAIDMNDLSIFCERWLEPGDNTAAWVTDDVNSPCIDAGDPYSAYAFEPIPNGGRINMGAYGNTSEASMSIEGTNLIPHPDMDGDGDVDFVDYAMFANAWDKPLLHHTIDYDLSGFIDEADLLQFTLWWLWGK